MARIRTRDPLLEVHGNATTTSQNVRSGRVASHALLSSRPTHSGGDVRLTLDEGITWRNSACSGGFGRRKRDVTFDGHAVGPLDGAQPGGYPGSAGGDGLAVAAAVGAFGQDLAKAFYFADVSFAFVG